VEEVGEIKAKTFLTQNLKIFVSRRNLSEVGEFMGTPMKDEQRESGLKCSE